MTACKEKPVQVDRLKLTFHNGQKQELSVRKHLKVGGKTRWIDLNGDTRCIKKIVFVGDTDTPRRRSKKQSRVTVFGKANASTTNTAQQSANEREELRLGAVLLGDLKERDSLRLPTCTGDANSPVRQVQVRVKKHPVMINRMKITFHNGQEQVLPVNICLNAGKSSLD